MAAGTLPRPGTTLGPCAGECKHTDCAATRAMADASCVYCQEPIGYDSRFYQDSEDGRPFYAHGDCAETAAECGADKLLDALRAAIGELFDADSSNAYFWTPRRTAYRGYGRVPAIYVGVAAEFIANDAGGVSITWANDVDRVVMLRDTKPDTPWAPPAGWMIENYSATIITFHRS